MSSERYMSHGGAVRGVAAVKENAVIDASYERRDARDGTLYFVLITRFHGAPTVGAVSTFALLSSTVPDAAGL